MAHERKGISDKTTLGDRGSLPAAGEAAPALALTILGHPSVERVGDRALGMHLAAGEPILLSRTEPVFVPPGQAEGEPIGDESLSRKPCG